MDAKLTIEAQPVGRNGAAILTAKLGDDVLHVEKLDTTKPKARTAFVDAICDGRRGIDRAAVEKELVRLAADLTKRNGSNATPTADAKPADDREKLLAKMPETVRAEARAMLDDPKLIERIVCDVAALGVAGERDLAATVYLVGTSRLLAKPLAAIVQGPSSSGKSFTVEAVADLFPREAVIHATAMTPQALFYMPPGSLSHRFIVAGERSRLENDETAEATRALREMLGSGRLTKLLPVKVEGRMETQVIEQDGPISYVESTTLAKIFDEDRNRCLLLHTDERPRQTRRIVETMAAGYAGDTAGGDRRAIVDRHHALQRMLEPQVIVIPYAKRLAELFGSDRVEARRAFPQIMSMIQTIALLHQRQRKVDPDGWLLATADDYHLTRHLLAGPMARLLGGRLSDPARRFFDRLAERFPIGQKFTTAEAAKGDAASRRAVTGWLGELCDVAGLAEQLEAHKGNKPAIWKLTDGDPDAGDDCRELPTVAELFPDAQQEV